MSKKNVIEQMIGLLRTPIAQRKGINIPSDECLIWAGELEKEFKSLISNSNDVQNPADKVEPKFHEGDWIVHNRTRVMFKIVDAKPMIITVVNTLGDHHTISTDAVEENYHLWSIKDARDGDVLATDSWLYIFKYTNNKALIQFHCTCPINGRPYKWCFSSDDSYLDIYAGANIHPATKEQRDILLQKMHEAGYNFDFEKKELKKIVLI